MIPTRSKSAGNERKALVFYTPPGFSTDTKYPVLHLLNGIGGDEAAVIPKIILHNLITDKKAVPMVIVMPNGRPVIPTLLPVHASPLDWSPLCPNANYLHPGKR